jgi:hypothetical protein
MSPQYYNADVFAMNFEGRRVSFARLLLRLLGSQVRNSRECIPTFMYVVQVPILGGFYFPASSLMRLSYIRSTLRDRTGATRTSQNSVMAKFAEFFF